MIIRIEKSLCEHYVTFSALLNPIIFFFIKKVLKIILIICSRSVISHLEKQAINVCARKGDFLEFQELKGVAELYAGIFFSRWLRGEISKAIRIGFIVTRMAQTMNSIFLKSLVLPRLAHLLMISRRHSEVVVLLRELGER